MAGAVLAGTTQVTDADQTAAVSGSQAGRRCGPPPPGSPADVIAMRVSRS